MKELDLPGFAEDAVPEFVDAASAKTWLENVPLANVAAAQQQLLAQAQEFNRYATKASDRLAAIEALREAVHFVQIEQARRFTNRALPMAEAESAVFSDTLALWEEMRLGYLHCLQAIGAQESGMDGQAALVCQRVLAYTGLRMFHHHRAYRQVPSREWRALHENYARAEALGVAEDEVKDYLNRDVKDTSPRIAYMRALLLGMANPNELSQRQLTFVAFLLERWAEKAEISREAPVEDVPSLVTDLASELCPEREGPAAADARYIQVRRLAKSLKNRIGLLRKGESPAKLALGEDCVQPSCEQLLVFLYRQWCLTQPARAAERKRVTDIAQACNDMGAIHYYVSGHVFKQPGGEKKELTAVQRDQIAAFGRISTRDEDDYSVVHGYLLEDWHVEDETAQGLRLVRRVGNAGKRYTHGQLIAVRPADSKGFMLGQVRWLMQNETGDLFCGVRLLPGLPAGTAVRPSGLNVQNVKYVQAILLTGAGALNAPPSLVLPAGWYKPQRPVEIYVDGLVRVKLTEILDRGSDYERCAYETAA